MSNLTPVVFVSHGAPSLALDSVMGADFARWGRALGEPTAIVVVSAHWERSPATVGTLEGRGLLYDFGGFDPSLRRVEYPAPGAPELAARVADLLGGVRNEPTRSWDHGVWVPLVHMFPAATVPLLQVSLPGAAGPRAVYDLGRALAPLRQEGVLLMGSGGMVHNLARLDWTHGSPPPSWAVEFDQWARAAIEGGDLEGLLHYRERAPAADLAHPSAEHFLPLLFAVGAAGPGALATYPARGFEYGSLARTSVELA
ncbi:DODA-type extradiol aromatic ring-opening family dioxygenase [Engelhardtia mirabilis]|uniref:LigB family dioxygenase n=1 Tax=Engelhardtia mirabilis TaxID=2528011 RepID=A0A518BDV2_9BACT|nr:LigB family dioxygenase [Planctomycetes bacterium Pla133]QDU99487.1 LigB family dioxygenase [Planctomycetes bacterium Pla86]